MIQGSLEQISSSMSSCSWNLVTMRWPSFLTGALKQQGTAYVYILRAARQARLLAVLSTDSIPRVQITGAIITDSPVPVAIMRCRTQGDGGGHAQSLQTTLASNAVLRLQQLQSARSARRGVQISSNAGESHFGWSTCRRSMLMSQKPRVASSMGVNFRRSFALMSSSILLTSPLRM